MRLQLMDADTPETLAGVVRLLRRAAELVWAAVDADSAGSPRQALALGIDLAADEARNLLPAAVATDGPVPVGHESAGLLRSAEQLLWRIDTQGAGCMSCGHGWPTWCGKRTPVSKPDRRTVGELLADSDALARETLLDATLEQAPGMVRSWKQLAGSAADLWAVVSSASDSHSGSDLMERLRAVGEAIGRSVTAGHWPGQGPTDERLIQIADNLSRAHHLVERPARTQPAALEEQPNIQDARGQVMHTLYVAAHGTAVAPHAYVADLKDRLEMGKRRREPTAERPTALEITEAQGMIARFSGFEQLAAAYLFMQPPTSANPGLVRPAAPATRLGSALAAWEIQAHRTLAANPDPADLVRVARVQALITTTTGILTEAAARKGHIDRDMIQQLAPALEANRAAWSRAAKRWGELTSPASRTDPALVTAASEVRAAIAATATNQAGWATPDQLASRIDLSAAVKTLHLSLVASVDIACIVRDTAADHPGLTAPARTIGMRAQGEAEIAIEQGETRYEGVSWITRRQIAANQLIPLPEPARRGLINLADNVIGTTNRAVAAVAQVDHSNVTRSIRSDPAGYRGHAFESLQVTRPQNPAPRGPRR
jgi:hypothetical protein